MKVLLRLLALIQKLIENGYEINEFGEIIRPTKTESQAQEQSDMVTLPNGIQIPKKQYEEEQGTKKQSKGISIGDVKSSISKGKVTTQESQSATQDMKKLIEIKRLQVDIFKYFSNTPLYQ